MCYGVAVDLIGATTNLESDLSVQSQVSDLIGDLAGPSSSGFAAGEEVVVLEQEERDSPIPVEVDHLGYHGLRLTESPQSAALGLVKGSDAAERTGPRAASGSKDRRRRQHL